MIHRKQQGTVVFSLSVRISNFEFRIFCNRSGVENFQRRILAAQGYHELGLWREAWRELDGLSDAAQKRPDVLEMRILILINERKWREALELSRDLAKAAPQEEGGWVHSAFCLHELGRTGEAIEVLQAAPASLRGKAIFHYNFACYSCALGRIDEARESLRRSFALDKTFRDFARSDRDLEPLRAELM
jgi:tetratricopeptide (TPR) repeat protein